MREFNLQKEMNKHLENFKKIDLDKPSTIMEWLYDILEYSILFEDERIADFIYRQLREHGYQEMKDPHMELKAFYSLMQEGKESDVEKIEMSLISQVMSSIKNHSAFDMSLYCFIKVYNERFNREYAIARMMSALENAVHSDIILVGIEKRQHFFKIGELNEVEPYELIKMNQKTYPFIGIETAISSIYSSDNIPLYSNLFIHNSYNLTDEEEISALKQKTFGNKCAKM